MDENIPTQPIDTCTNTQQNATTSTNVFNNICALINKSLGSETSPRACNNIHAAVQPQVTDFTEGIPIEAHISKTIGIKYSVNLLPSILQTHIENNS